MPQELGYTRQTRPQAGAPLPAVSAESYGAGLGQAIAGAAEQANATNLRGYAIERERTQDAEWSRFQHEFGVARDDVDRITREYRKDGEPGHAQRVMDLYEQRREALLGGITEDRVRQHAAAQFEEFGSRLHANEADFEEVKRSEGVVRNTESAWDIADNRVRRMDNHDDYLGEMQLRHDAIDALNVADDVKDKMHQAAEQRGELAFARGWLDRDPQGAKDALRAGLFDQLDPDTVNALLNNADVEIRSQEVAAAREAAVQAAGVKEAVATLEQRNTNGEVIADEDFAVAEAALTRLGDTSGAERVAGIRSENQVVRQWGPANATPAQRERRMAEIAAILPDQRSAAMNRELRVLQEKSPGWDAQFASDPAGALARSGGMPPIDFTDPHSLARRAEWRRVQSDATGRYIPPLTRAEAAPLAELKARHEEQQVLAALDGFADPFDRLDAAQVIDPDDKLFQRMAVMAPVQRAMVRQGAHAIDANPKLLTPESDASAGAEAQRKWEGRLAFALREIDPEDADAVRQSARLILASVLSKNPGAKIDGLAERTFATAVQMALGREDHSGTRIGGLATWGDETPFIVAEGYSAASLRDALIRDRQAQDAAGSGPVEPDGETPASFARAYPVWLGGTRYRWETPGGSVLRDRDGQVFIQTLRPR